MCICVVSGVCVQREANEVGMKKKEDICCGNDKKEKEGMERGWVTSLFARTTRFCDKSPYIYSEREGGERVIGFALGLLSLFSRTFHFREFWQYCGLFETRGFRAGGNCTQRA